MKRPLVALVSTLCLVMPAVVSAQALECVDPAPVFKEAGATTFDLQALAQTVGTAELDGGSLPAVAEQVRRDYPHATDADVADILITAFCTYLNDDAPADHRSEANVAAFEQEVYTAVYGGTPPDTYERHGWLYGN